MRLTVWTRGSATGSTSPRRRSGNPGPRGVGEGVVDLGEARLEVVAVAVFDVGRQRAARVVASGCVWCACLWLCWRPSSPVSSTPRAGQSTPGRRGEGWRRMADGGRGRRGEEDGSCEEADVRHSGARACSRRPARRRCSPAAASAWPRSRHRRLAPGRHHGRLRGGLPSAAASPRPPRHRRRLPLPARAGRCLSCRRLRFSSGPRRPRPSPCRFPRSARRAAALAAAVRRVAAAAAMRARSRRSTSSPRTWWRAAASRARPWPSSPATHHVHALLRPARDRPSRLVNDDTLFQLGGVSQAYTTTLLAALAGEGEIGWDQPVRRVWPGFRLKDRWARQATFRDLTAARSGLPGYAGSELRAFGYGRAEILGGCATSPRPPASAPRTRLRTRSSRRRPSAPSARPGTRGPGCCGRVLVPIGDDGTVTGYRGFGPRDRATPHRLVDGSMAPQDPQDESVFAPSLGGAEPEPARVFRAPAAERRRARGRARGAGGHARARRGRRPRSTPGRRAPGRRPGLGARASTAGWSPAPKAASRAARVP